MTRDYLFGEPRETVRNIVRHVARSSGLSVADIYGPSRRAHLVKARHAAMYIACKKGGHSLSKVGRIFGNRDHTTVMSAVRKVEANPQAYPLADEISGDKPDHSHTDYSTTMLEYEGNQA